MKIIYNNKRATETVSAEKMTVKTDVDVRKMGEEVEANVVYHQQNKQLSKNL